MQSRNMLGAMVGVNAGLLQDVGQISGAISNGEWTESDARAVRRAIYMNNLHILYQAFNKFETSIGGKE